ncbi:hypothetical protein JHD46_00190 [Sulfurimonas sp. SAG-AH-194-C20]|nr:DUF6781 family protein [Sulfurimonas sp. SAG-AH-194-C20]MDF1878050.1 hypothetical protein [Sulfurimonas sp. SAG-AH-194-C20]
MAQEIQTNLQAVYNKRFKTIDKRILTALQEGKINFDSLSLEEVRGLTTAIINLETQTLQDDVQTLLEKKEAIERELEKKSEALQETKYTIFNILEDEVLKSENALAKLHQVKLQSIDLYDILSEMVESAIITALEKDRDGDIIESTTEVIKEISFESIKEGSLNTIRVRKILSTILVSAIDVAEATPNRAEQILNSTLKGMRGGLIKSIDRFKQRLEFMPVEAKHILIEDYDTIIEDLNQTDTLFSQVVITQAHESSQEIKNMLIKLNKEMAYDLEELILISKETADIMKSKFSSFAKTAMKRADIALKSPKAQEAKRMGMQAFGVAKLALGSAIKYGKDAIDKK